MKTTCSSANAWKSVPQRRMYFLRKGASQFARNKCRAPRKHLLAYANDWEIAADLEGLMAYPQVLRESGKRPDSVIVSARTFYIRIGGVDDSMGGQDGVSNCLKEERYSELALDLNDKGYKVWLFAIELGARGLGRKVHVCIPERYWPHKQGKDQVYDKDFQSCGGGVTVDMDKERSQAISQETKKDNFALVEEPPLWSASFLVRSTSAVETISLLCSHVSENRSQSRGCVRHSIVFLSSRRACWGYISRCSRCGAIVQIILVMQRTLIK